MAKHLLAEINGAHRLTRRLVKVLVLVLHSVRVECSCLRLICVILQQTLGQGMLLKKLGVHRELLLDYCLRGVDWVHALPV